MRARAAAFHDACGSFLRRGGIYQEDLVQYLKLYARALPEVLLRVRISSKREVVICILKACVAKGRAGE